MSLLLTLLLTLPATDSVTLLRTPNNGIQPQAVVDGKGTIHLIYFQGEARAGDLYYVHREAGQKDFSKPLRVNSKPESAIATGTVRGGQLALGKNNRIHVAWNGAAGTGGMQYARLNDAGTAFEEQRNLMQLSQVPDGGCTVAADAAGHVTVAWHAVAAGEGGEEQRKMWVARSHDEGKTFAAEAPAWQNATGACGCCSTRAFADQSDTYLLYRAAKDRDQRDIYLLHTNKQDADFQGTLLHRWKIASCPMSTYALASGPGGVVAAWDTDGQVFYTTIKPGTTEFNKPQAAPGTNRGRKHPALAVNSKGETILVWTEGTGWQRGGALAWQVLDAAGQPTEVKGRLDRGIPVWGLPTVVATANGFVIIH